jgi:ACS family tartrate transporter-like MFS transporter
VITAEFREGAADAAIRSGLRKTGLRLLPLIGLGYGVALMDRVNISFAALQMNQDLKFSATTYGLGAGLFFLTYASLEIPSNLLLARFGARRWLTRILLTWGLISMAMIFVRSTWHFYVLRLLLGACEAGFFPGAIYYLSQWFPDSYRSRAFSRFYIAGPLSYTVMGMLAGSLLGLNGRLGLAGWQWLFLVEGMPAVLMALAFFTLLPDTPAEAKWLTADERTALEDVARHAKGEGEAPHGVTAVLGVLGDIRVWLLGLFLFGIILVGYGYTFVAPLLLKQVTGLSNGKVGMLIASFGLLGAAGMLINGWHSDKTGERYWHIMVPSLVLCAGFVAMGIGHSPTVVVLGAGATALVHFAVQVPMLTLAPAFLRGKSAAAGVAAVNSIALVGGFVGPYWVGHAVELAGNYRLAMLTLAVPVLVSAGLITAFHRRARRVRMSEARLVEE